MNIRVIPISSKRVKATRFEQMKKQGKEFQPERQPRNKEDIEEVERESDANRLSNTDRLDLNHFSLYTASLCLV